MSRLQDHEQSTIEDESLQDHTLTVTGSSSDLSDAADDTSRLRTENAILKAESKLLNESLAKDAVRTVCLEAEVAAKANEVKKLKSTVKTITIRTRQECAGELEEIVRELHVAVEKLVMENKNLKARRRELERRLKCLQQENQGLQRECLSLKAQLQDAVEKDGTGHLTAKIASVGHQLLECVRRSDSCGASQSASRASKQQEQQQQQQKPSSKDSSLTSWTNFFSNVLSTQSLKTPTSQPTTGNVSQLQITSSTDSEMEGITDSHDPENPELD